MQAQGTWRQQRYLQARGQGFEGRAWNQPAVFQRRPEQDGYGNARDRARARQSLHRQHLSFRVCVCVRVCVCARACLGCNQPMSECARGWEGWSEGGRE